MTDYAGIDYSLGQANFDKENGIHYGVVPMNDLHEWAWEHFETVYNPVCPHCVSDLDDNFESPEDCPHCGKFIRDGAQFGDEPDKTILDDGTYKAGVDSSNEVWIFKSPYYTHAQFCSPCAPGAGYLRNPVPDGPKTYCFGPEWFEENKCPYPVYSVETEELVFVKAVE